MGSKKTKQNNFIVQGSILAIASILVRLIGIVYRIPMVRYIGDEGSGYYSIAFNIYNIALILSSYSLPLAVSKLIAARNVKKEYKNTFRIFLAALLFAAISGFVFTCLIYFGAEFLAHNVYNTAGIIYPLKVLAPTIFVVAIIGVFRGFYQGKNTMLPTAVSQVIEQIANAIVSVVAAYMLMKAHDASMEMASYGAAGGTLGTFVGAVAGLAFLLLVFALYFPNFQRLVHRDRSPRQESYGYIYRLLFMTIFPVILSQTLYQVSGILDDIIFSKILAAKNIDETIRSQWLGIYSSKYKLLSNVPIAIASAMASSMIPSMVASVTLKDMDAVKYKVYSTVKFNMLIAIPSAVGMTVLAKPIMQLCFPGSSELANNLLLFGSVAIVFYALSTITNAVLQGINHMRIPVIHTAISLVIHLILLVALLQFTNMNVYALLVGNITFPFVICVLNWIQIKRRLSYHQEVMTTFIIPTISACIMGVVTFLVYKGADMILPNIVSTILAIGIGVVIYFGALIALKGIDGNELERLPMGRKLVQLCKKIHIM